MGLTAALLQGTHGRGVAASGAAAQVQNPGGAPGLCPRARSGQPRRSDRSRRQVNRKAYSEDAQGIIRRQRAAIEKLQADNTNMKHELDNSAAARPRPRAPDPAAQLPRTGRRRAEHQRAAGDRAAARDRRRLHSQGSVCHVANSRCRLTPARKLAQIEAEKKRASALDARIRAFDAEALAKRRSMGGTTDVTVHTVTVHTARLTPARAMQA